MGMFDEIRCKLPLPLPQYQENLFQTKDTPAQWMDLYEIREDGTLWREAYETEDQSNKAKWIAAHPGEPVPAEMESMTNAFFGMLSRVNKRWEPLADFAGEIRFYNTLPPNHSGWVKFSAYFVAGKVNQLNLVEHRPN